MHLSRSGTKQTLAAILLPLALVGFTGYGRRDHGAAHGIATVPMPLAAPAVASTHNRTDSGSMFRYAEAMEQLRALLDHSDIPLYKVLDGWSLSILFYVHELGTIKQIYDQFTVYEQRKLRGILYHVKHLLKSRYGFKAQERGHTR